MIGGVFLLPIGLSIFLGVRNWDSWGSHVFAIPAIFLPFWIGLFVILFRERKRFHYLTLKFSFYEDGIHCRGLGWKPFVLPWTAIRAYGIAYKFDAICYAYFSKDPKIKPCSDVEALRASEDLIFFQVRDEIAEEAYRYMPSDIEASLIKAGASTKPIPAFYRRVFPEKWQKGPQTSAQQARDGVEAMEQKQRSRIICMAYFFKYSVLAFIFGPLIASFVFPNFTSAKTALCLCLAFLYFGLYSFAGLRGKWKHVYCAYQNMTHYHMTPEKTDWNGRIAQIIKLSSTVFLVIGAGLLILTNLPK